MVKIYGGGQKTGIAMRNRSKEELLMEGDIYRVVCDKEGNSIMEDVMKDVEACPSELSGC